MKYVLILAVAQGIFSAQFDDYTACRNAAEQVKEAFGMDYKWWCVPQSTNVPTTAGENIILDNGGD